jgi:predicted RNase H-like nuclease (RuvC/YqgF family)
MGTPLMTVEQFIYATDGQPTTAGALKAKIAMLQAEIAKLEALMAGHQTEFRALVERDRAERLMAELLRLMADLMSAREATAWLERELTDLRFLRSSRPWWCRMLAG